MRALACVAFTRDQASSTSQTLRPPRRTNAKPSATLTVGVNIVCLREGHWREPARIVYRLQPTFIPTVRVYRPIERMSAHVSARSLGQAQQPGRPAASPQRSRLARYNL